MNVSAVIVTLNRRNYLRRAIDSVLAQTVPVDEIIVVNDERTTDGTPEALNEWYGDRVRVVDQGGGLSGVRRRGVQEARGEWVAFLDSDDDWSLERNALLLEAAKRVPADVAWIFGDMQVVTEGGNGKTLFERNKLTVKKNPEVFADSISVQYPFQFGLLQGSFIRRRALLEVDCFNEGLQSSEDLLTGFQIACRYKYAAIPNVVGRYFVTSDLAASSASVHGVFSPDYYRARVLSFALVAESGHRRPWNARHAEMVRGLCKVLAERGQSPRGLVLQQFRFGALSTKSIAFLCAALAGRRGIQAWSAGTDFLKKRLAATERRFPKNGLQTHTLTDQS